MSLLVDVNAWIADRGYGVTVANADILRAIDYFQTLNWIEDAEPDWTDHSTWDDSVFKAVCIASKMEKTTPGILMPETSQRIRSESVDVIRIEYEPGGGNAEIIALKRFLTGLIRSPATIRVELV